MTNLVILTKENFKETIETNPFIIVDFWAPWCEPCVNFTPVFEAAAKKNNDRDRAGIHAQVGEIGAPALDEIIKWAREFDMSTIEDYYKKQNNNEFN